MERSTNTPGLPAVWTYLTIIVVIALGMATGPFALAEESTPDPGVVVQPEPSEDGNPPAPAEQDAPIIPAPPVESDSPLAPGQGSTTDPEPEPPTNPEPTATHTPDVPPPDAPIIPEPVGTDPTETGTPGMDEPEIPETPDATSTPNPSPTAEPTPVVTWSQSESVQCALRDGAPDGLRYAESHTYSCEVRAFVTSDIAMPEDMEIEWTLDVSFPDTYLLQFPPASQAFVKSQAPGPTTTSTTYIVGHPWQQGGEQRLAFELVVTRNSCTVGEHVLGIQASPQIFTGGSEAQILRASGDVNPQPAQMVSQYLANIEPPSVSMTTVEFDSLYWDGSSWGTAIGTGKVTLDHSIPCATSQPYLVQVDVLTSNPGLETHVSNVVTPEGVEVSDSGIALIPAGFEGTAEVIVEFTLTPDSSVQVGVHSFDFQVFVTPVP